jgi:O-methyltransferase
VRALSNAWSRPRSDPPSAASARPEAPGGRDGHGEQDGHGGGGGDDTPSQEPHPTGHGLRWPAFPPRHYLGQLTPEFQSYLRAAWANVDRTDCDFYHASLLSDGTVVPGPWDLRGREPQYLGQVDLAGERVLELGPASGALTYFMEDSGAQVVGFDVGFDVCGDILPMPGLDPVQQRVDYVNMVSRVQNSWWYLHRDRRSRTEIAYGDIYNLPGDLGTFDTSVFCAILLHLRDPFRALQEAAARTRRRIVVTDALQDPSLGTEDNLLRFASANFQNLTLWWTLTPGTIQHMLRHLGFSEIRTSLSDHTHYLGHDMDTAPIEQRMFTVVGERPA